MAVAILVGWNLTHPARKALSVTPARYALAYEDVTFPSREDHLDLHGWYIPATGPAPAGNTIILAHGFKGNREETGPGALQVANFLTREGYNVLLFDFRASGESAGDEVTVGGRETRDLAGAVDYVRSRGARKVGIIGWSMGAATALLTAAQLPEVEAVVADSAFSELGPFVLENGKHWTKLPDFPFTYVIYAVIPSMLGLSFDEVSPLQAMKHVADRPVLLIHGTKDDAVGQHHSARLLEAYKAAGGTEGELWIVPDAKHVGAYRVATAEYQERLRRFLGNYLGGTRH